VTWQSEVLWENGVGGAGQQKDSTATPLFFESIETSEKNGVGEFARDAEAESVQAASELEHNLKMQNELHAAEIEDSVRRAQVEERDRCEDEFKNAIDKERETIARLCGQLGDERRRYFDQVEGEIVKLSLAIAAQILHREIKLDPLLLTGVVQVALKQIQDGSDVVLRVPQLDTESWNQRFEDTPNNVTVSVVGDDRLSPGDCVLETNIGTVNLGIEAQLAEIGRGFFDLLKQRPA